MLKLDFSYCVAQISPEGTTDQDFLAMAILNHLHRGCEENAFDVAKRPLDDSDAEDLNPSAIVLNKTHTTLKLLRQIFDSCLGYPKFCDDTQLSRIIVCAVVKDCTSTFELVLIVADGSNALVALDSMAIVNRLQ
ncbi:hypothetical protein Z517_04415 [Fonsecaea pedrosoi CBS 271.37]|uniref:Unplaced genomic scaffold supercont1.3, whole genome shotgun sequence n=1 Tax=Fonsecaea pedrosoi CBS 271.37 TaxID=1442368 RepID=A0A0D2GS72_9EURO|nr:uncharacterized protein Z517_04415 [Fonsecaea pedrosoi CBS 271.37]KIW81390.1 hypothetical protein Z517_04415 [Fonsecaea pedrosoi CBS 271.37]